ncbi:MAG: AbrB family transcriptional regulator [Xanthobacteraceae bacterium]
MTSCSESPSSERLAEAGWLRRDSLQAAETLLIGAAGGAVFAAARFPAGWLAGAMIFCAAAALLGRPLGVPRPVARFFSVIVGMALGGVVNPVTLHGVAAWPLSVALIALAMACVTFATMTYLRRVHGWDGMTALLAGFPGALGQVMAYAAEENCDMRAIAIVQMMRVAILTIGVPAALAALGLTAADRGVVQATGIFDAPGELVLLIVACVAAGFILVRLGLPGGLLIGPMVVSAALHGSGLISATLPLWVTVIGMIGIGSIGGARFAGTPARLVLSYLWAALGAFAVSLAIAALFASMAGLLVYESAGDIAVAYLPGAIDAMMVLALALDLDPIFVGAHHLARLLGLSLALPVVISALRQPAAPSDESPRSRNVRGSSDRRPFGD